jgi:4-oxalocrotonate tautomerase
MPTGFRRRTESAKECQVPLINVKLIEGVFSPAEKRQIVEKLTETMLSIEGESMRDVTWVVLEEVRSGEWGIGGKALTTEDVKGLRAAVAAG